MKLDDRSKAYLFLMVAVLLMLLISLVSSAVIARRQTTAPPAPQRIDSLQYYCDDCIKRAIERNVDTTAATNTCRALYLKR